MSIDTGPEAQTADRRPTTPATVSSSARNHAQTGSWWKRALLVAGVLGVLAAAAPALIRTVTPKTGTRVLTYTIARGDLVVSVTEDGTLESSTNTEIKCKVKGGSTVLWVVATGTEVKPDDVLVRLDTSTIEDNISQQKIVYETSLANKITSDSDVAVAKISITEYLDGTFRSEMATKEKELVIAESNLKSAKNARDHAQRMFRKGYISKLQLETSKDAVKHAELDVKVKQTDLEVLDKFTKAKTLQEKESLLDVTEARLASDTATLELEKVRLTRKEQQLENCVIRADVAGMVIYPSAAEWKEQPDIEEGASVREDQVLLIIPDLKQMQVKIGIHESKVDRVKPGMEARIELQDHSIDGEVLSIASITKPTGWWNGNVVKYETIIKLHEQQSLKPGMSVAVEVFLARHKDVLTIPVAAVVEQGQEFLCWVETDDGIVKRSLKLGDSNDQFMVVEEGLQQGERVVLNPIDFVDEAQTDALKPIHDSQPEKSDARGPADKSPHEKRASGDEGGAKKSPPSGDAIIKIADKNGDGVLTKDEFDEKMKPHFESTDTDGNGEVDASEIEAGLKRMQPAAAEKK